MTEKNTGGFIIPKALQEDLLRQLRAENPWQHLLDTKDFRPPKRTLRMRYRIWRADVRARLHDWLFPEYRRDEWDD